MLFIFTIVMNVGQSLSRNCECFRPRDGFYFDVYVLFNFSSIYFYIKSKTYAFI